MHKLEAVIKALDVSQVVWVDDLFSKAHADTPPDPMTLAIVIENAGTAAELGIDAEYAASPEDISVRLTADYELYRRALTKHPDAATSVADRKMINAIENGVGVGIRKVPGRDWLEELKQPEAAYSKTLFLVDKDFAQEQLDSAASAELLKSTVGRYLMQCDSNFCVVLSKDVTEENQQSFRKGLVEEIPGFADETKAVLRFSAVSKEALAADAKGALATRLTYGLGGVILAEALTEVVKTLDASVDELEKEIVYKFEDLTKGILANAYAEGISEIDVLLRIINQSHRLGLAKNFKEQPDHPLKALLHRFRLFQLENTVVPEDHEMAKDGLLQKLGFAEVITEGQLINSLRLPIVPGDVFEVLDESFKAPDPASDTLELGHSYYMLLGQLCDIVARGKDGETKARLAFLAPFKVKTKAEKRKDEKGSADFQVTGQKRGIEVKDKAMIFDFRDVLVANIAALQFVAYDVDGYARVSTGTDTDEGWSLPSMIRARKAVVDKLRGKTAPPDDLSRYAVGFDGSDAATRTLTIAPPVAGNSTCAYRIRRVCRVRDLEAVEALLAIQRYWARIAKPMDFME